MVYDLSTINVKVGDGGNAMSHVSWRPDAGFHVHDARISNKSVGAQSFCDLTNQTGTRTVTVLFLPNEPSFLSPWGGINAKSKGINYQNYIHVNFASTTPWTKEAWLPLLDKLNIRLVLLTNCLVAGDVTQPATAAHDLREVAAFFKANGIGVMLYTYADLISPASKFAEDGRNLRHNSDGTPMMAYGNHVPTPAASLVIAKKLADLYNSLGLDGIYFDAVDYYHSKLPAPEPETGANFLNTTVKLIPGNCPIGAASQFTTATALPGRVGGKDGQEARLREFAVEYAAWLATIIPTGNKVPFFGWLQVLPGVPYSVDDLQVYLEQSRSVGAAYAITGLNPTHATDPRIVPYVDMISAHNASWNPRVISVQDSSGASIAGAAVTVLDVDGVLVFSGTNNSRGYVVCNLGGSIMLYGIQISHNGKTQTEVNYLNSKEAVLVDTKIIFFD